MNNELEIFKQKCADIDRSLDTMDDITLGNVYRVCDWEIKNIKDKARIKILEHFNSDTKLKLCDTEYLDIKNHKTDDTIVYEDEFNTREILRYIAEKNIGIENIPIDYKTLKNMDWFKQALKNTEGYLLMTSKPVTKEGKLVQRLEVKPINREE